MNGNPACNGRDERGRVTVLPPALREHMFKKGEVRNPRGRGGEYQRCLMLCREASYAAALEIIRLSKESEDDRVRYMAGTWVYQYAWGKPKDYDQKAEESKKESPFNPRDYSPDQLNVIEQLLQILSNPLEKHSSSAATLPKGPIGSSL